MRTLLLPFMVFSMLLLGTGCKQNTEEMITQFVRGIEVALENQEGDLVIKVSSLIYLRNLLLPTIDLPIVNPNEPARPYGRIRILAPLDFNGVHKVGFDLNLSQIAPIPPVGVAKLPNGHELPFTGIDNSKVIQLTIDSIDSVFYFALDRKTSFLGYAIVIDEFDEVGEHVGSLDFFPVFQFLNIVGAAGLFSGTQQRQGGLAFFVNLSKVLTQEIIEDLLTGNHKMNHPLNNKYLTQKLSDAEIADLKKMFKNRNKMSPNKEAQVKNKLQGLTNEKKRLNFVEK